MNTHHLSGQQNSLSQHPQETDLIQSRGSQNYSNSLIKQENDRQPNLEVKQSQSFSQSDPEIDGKILNGLSLTQQRRYSNLLKSMGQNLHIQKSSPQKSINPQMISVQKEQRSINYLKIDQNTKFQQAQGEISNREEIHQNASQEIKIDENNNEQFIQGENNRKYLSFQESYNASEDLLSIRPHSQSLPQGSYFHSLELHNENAFEHSADPGIDFSHQISQEYQQIGFNCQENYFLQENSTKNSNNIKYGNAQSFNNLVENTNNQLNIVEQNLIERLQIEEDFTSFQNNENQRQINKQSQGSNDVQRSQEQKMQPNLERQFTQNQIQMYEQKPAIESNFQKIYRQVEEHEIDQIQGQCKITQPQQFNHEQPSCKMTISIHEVHSDQSGSNHILDSSPQIGSDNNKIEQDQSHLFYEQPKNSPISKPELMQIDEPNQENPVNVTSTSNWHEQAFDRNLSEQLQEGQMICQKSESLPQRKTIQINYDTIRNFYTPASEKYAREREKQCQNSQKNQKSALMNQQLQEIEEAHNDMEPSHANNQIPFQERQTQDEIRVYVDDMQELSDPFPSFNVQNQINEEDFQTSNIDKRIKHQQHQNSSVVQSWNVEIPQPQQHSQPLRKNKPLSDFLSNSNNPPENQLPNINNFENRQQYQNQLVPQNQFNSHIANQLTEDQRIHHQQVENESDHQINDQVCSSKLIPNNQQEDRYIQFENEQISVAHKQQTIPQQYISLNQQLQVQAPTNPNLQQQQDFFSINLEQQIQPQNYQSGQLYVNPYESLKLEIQDQIICQNHQVKSSINQNGSVNQCNQLFTEQNNFNLCLNEQNQKSRQQQQLELQKQKHIQFQLSNDQIGDENLEKPQAEPSQLRTAQPSKQSRIANSVKQGQFNSKKNSFSSSFQNVSSNHKSLNNEAKRKFSGSYKPSAFTSFLNRLSTDSRNQNDNMRAIQRLESGNDIEKVNKLVEIQSTQFKNQNQARIMQVQQGIDRVQTDAKGSNQNQQSNNCFSNRSEKSFQSNGSRSSNSSYRYNRFIDTMQVPELVGLEIVKSHDGKQAKIQRKSSRSSHHQRSSSTCKKSYDDLSQIHMQKIDENVGEQFDEKSVKRSKKYKGKGISFSQNQKSNHSEFEDSQESFDKRKSQQIEIDNSFKREISSLKKQDPKKMSFVPVQESQFEHQQGLQTEKIEQVNKYQVSKIEPISNIFSNNSRLQRRQLIQQITHQMSFSYEGQEKSLQYFPDFKEQVVQSKNQIDIKEEKGNMISSQQLEQIKREAMEAFYLSKKARLNIVSQQIDMIVNQNLLGPDNQDYSQKKVQEVNKSKAFVTENQSVHSSQTRTLDDIDKFQQNLIKRPNIEAILPYFHGSGQSQQLNQDGPIGMRTQNYKRKTRLKSSRKNTNNTKSMSSKETGAIQSFAIQKQMQQPPQQTKTMVTRHRQKQVKFSFQPQYKQEQSFQEVNSESKSSSSQLRQTIPTVVTRRRQKQLQSQLILSSRQVVKEQHVQNKLSFNNKDNKKKGEQSQEQVQKSKNDKSLGLPAMELTQISISDQSEDADNYGKRQNNRRKKKSHGKSTNKSLLKNTNKLQNKQQSPKQHQNNKKHKKNKQLSKDKEHSLNKLKISTNKSKTNSKESASSKQQRESSSEKQVNLNKEIKKNTKKSILIKQNKPLETKQVKSQQCKLAESVLSVQKDNTHVKQSSSDTKTNEQERVGKKQYKLRGRKVQKKEESNTLSITNTINPKHTSEKQKDLKNSTNGSKQKQNKQRKNAHIVQTTQQQKSVKFNLRSRDRQ